MVCRGWPASEFSYVASNIRVAGGKRTPLSKVSEQLQIARLVLFGVNIKSEALHNRSLRNMEGTAAIAEV
jgi:hypothetical protein